MGCDIHCFAEVKINGRWEHYGPLKIYRFYTVFNAMANCGRGDSELRPKGGNRGIPRDSSFMTKFHADNYGEDGHSHSWLSRLEFSALIHHFKDDIDPSAQEQGKDYFFGNGWDLSRDNWNEYIPEVQDVRWVFWFDN